MRPAAHEADYPVPFTAIPNAILDEWMRALSPNAFKVLLCVLRKTLGWHRTEAPISLSEMLEYTGIGSYQTLMVAIRELIDVQVLEVDEHRGIRGTKIYALTARLLSTPTEIVGVPENQSTTPTEIVREPLQKQKGNSSRNRKGTPTEIVGDASRQARQGTTRHAPKETLKEKKDNEKEIAEAEEEPNAEQEDGSSASAEGIVAQIAHDPNLRIYLQEYQRAQEIYRTAKVGGSEWREAKKAIRNLEWQCPQLLSLA